MHFYEVRTKGGLTEQKCEGQALSLWSYRRYFKQTKRGVMLLSLFVDKYT